MHVNEEKLLCVIVHLLPHIVTKVEFDAVEESKPAPLIVKLNPPAVPPCGLDKPPEYRGSWNHRLALFRTYVLRSTLRNVFHYTRCSGSKGMA